MLCSTFTPYLPIRTLNLVLRLLLRVTVLIGLAVLRKQRFPFRDTGYFAVNGVSLLWMVCLGVVVVCSRCGFVRDTGYSLEKGVSLHECSGKRCFFFHDTGNLAEKGVSRRVRCEERKGSGSGWDGRAVESRKETASGLCHESGGSSRNGSPACAKAAGGEGQNQNKNRSQGNLKPVLICLRV